MTQLQDKTVLVTGGASGIGKITATAFARAGAVVYLGDIDEPGGNAVVEELKQLGASASFIKLDVSDASQVEAAVARVVEERETLDLAFNNAGIEGLPARFADTPDDVFDAIMRVNVRGVWLCMKAELEQMTKQRRGAIVNTASVAGLVGAHQMSAYAASKHAVVGLTKTAAIEYAKVGVRVNAVCPAVIQTEMVTRMLQSAPEMMKPIVDAHPIGRVGEPQEVANAVLWLCSDEASFVTGAALTVDGGLTAR